jgi:hypothetical protein
MWSRPALPGPYARDLRAARQKKRRETIEFWAKVLTPIATVVAVMVALYQAELATITTNTMFKNSLRERTAEDRKDRDRLEALTAEVLNETEKLPASPWLRPNATEDEFNQGKRDTLELIQALTRKIDDAKSGISDPWYWEFTSLWERSFASDLRFEIAANDAEEGPELASRKAVLTAAIQEITHRLKDELQGMLQTLDARIPNEIDQLYH